MTSIYYQTGLDFVGSPMVKDTLSKAFLIITVIILAVISEKIIIKFISSTVKRTKKGDLETSESLQKRINTMSGVLKNAAKVIIWFTVLVIILSSVGVNIASIITGAGILGLAVGFGTQTLVKDVVTGFFIILENQYNKGDWVKIADLEGEVKSINLRTTILKDKDGSIHIIPNSQVVKVTRFRKKN